MGITVIPASAVALQPVSSTGTGSVADNIAGDFAALLSGELLGQQLAGNPLLDGERGNARSDSPDDGTPGGPDPGLLAALFGHPDGKPSAGAAPLVGAAHETDALPGIAGRPGGTLTEAGNTLAGQRPTSAALFSQAQSAANERPSLPGATADRGSAMASFGNQLANTLRTDTANIAAAPSTETPPITGMPPAGANAQPPAHGLEKLTSTTSHGAVPAQLHSAAWPQQFGEKIVWLARNEQQSAQLTINPPQLGPIQISLNLSGDQASISFASPHAEVRQAIESAMPQLKDMLSSAGINLGQSNVGANLSQQAADNPFANANGKRAPDENAILPANDNGANAAGSPVLQRGRGLVDLFA